MLLFFLSQIINNKLLDHNYAKPGKVSPAVE